MLRTKTVRFHRRRTLGVVLAAFFALLALPGSALAQGEPPVVSNAMVTPGSLTHLGGNVTVTADVNDDSNALNIVWVDVYGPFWFSVALTQGSGSDWFGTVEIPANFTPDPVGWQFEVRARDLDDQEGVAYAGEVEVAGEPQFDEAPTVWDPAVTPRDVPSGGGPVALSVSASDLRGISEAYAVVSGASGATTVPLEPTSSSRFEGVFNAPANTSASPVQYSVEMVALDDIGQPGTADGGLITVAAAAPQTGQLQIRPAALRFGATKVGKRAHRFVVVRNVGAKGTAPVQGVIRTSGAPFRIVGGGRFRLRPGRSASFLVEFRPTSQGAKTGTLSVSRPDLAQPTLSIPLSGRGTR